MSDRMIDDYVSELREHLRVPARRRRRILAEVEDHLACAAAELCSPEEAVRRFGPPRDLAQTFVDQAAARGGLRSAQAAGVVGVLTGALVTTAPGGPLFQSVFPSGVFAFVLGQVALVVGVVTFARGLAPPGGPRGARLAFVMRGAYVVLTCAVAASLFGAVRAATGRGGWGVDAWIALGLLVLGATVSGATVASSRKPAGASSASPENQYILADIGLALERAARRVPMLRQAAPLIRSLASRVPRLVSALDLRRRPWRCAFTVSVAAGLTAAIGHGVTEEPTTNHLARQLGAAAIIAGVEALAALLGFAVLGRYLGLRSHTSAEAPEPRSSAAK
jgi:hypothetical protein